MSNFLHVVNDINPLTQRPRMINFCVNGDSGAWILNAGGELMGQIVGEEDGVTFTMI